MKSLVLATIILFAYVPGWGQTAPGAFSGLKSQLEQSLQSALAQTTPLKSRWKLPVLEMQGPVRSAVSDQGISLVAVVSEDRLTLQLWSSSSRAPWGEALTLDGMRIEHVSVTWGADRTAWVAWSGGTQARVATWSGLAWVKVRLPGSTWQGPLTWTPGLRLWGTQVREGRTYLDSAFVEGSAWRPASRNGGLGLPPGARWSIDELGGRLVLAVNGISGGVYEANPRSNGEWSSLGFPEVLDDLPVWGSVGPDLALLVRPGSASSLWIFSTQEGWREHAEARSLTALSSSAALLMATSGGGSSLLLHQFDGETWRVPLPLAELLEPSATVPQVQFLPPPGKGKTGLLVLGTDGWELP